MSGKEPSGRSAVQSEAVDSSVMPSKVWEIASISCLSFPAENLGCVDGEFHYASTLCPEWVFAFTQLRSLLQPISKLCLIDP